MSASFTILEHTADIGFSAWGATVEELFENSARAMMAIAAEACQAETPEERHVEVTGEDYESLLVNWLSEVLYLFDSEEFAAADFHVDTIAAAKTNTGSQDEPARLRARLAGEKRDPARHRWSLIVKAVTYYEIEVVERNGRWESRVFLDI
jgi:SHS2 domain-containing protein